MNGAVAMNNASHLSMAQADGAEALLEMRFVARPDRLKLIRGSIRSSALMCGFDDEAAQNIVLAIDEACQNIIVHGYGRGVEGAVILSLFRHNGGILVHLRDFAKPVDPSKVQPRDLTDIRPGKLGSHFIRSIMDTVEFRKTSNSKGNLLEMTKRLGQPL
jgi:sigma-B regulation protein RsbU (phosphoserine phosphatase)